MQTAGAVPRTPGPATPARAVRVAAVRGEVGSGDETRAEPSGGREVRGAELERRGRGRAVRCGGRCGGRAERRSRRAGQPERRAAHVGRELERPGAGAAEPERRGRRGPRRRAADARWRRATQLPCLSLRVVINTK